MSNKELAQEIIKRFSPFAFTCECGGTDEDCADARTNPVLYNQYATVVRIAKWLETQED